MKQDTVWNITKTEATAPNGMVTSMHPLASAAGLEMLQAGGNAVDAAVAMAFASGVVEPFMSGLGGVACLVFYRASDGAITVLDGSGVAPTAAREDMYELADVSQKAGLYGWRATKGDAQNLGYRAVCVPGMPAALMLALERFGTLSRQQVLAPAIRLAEDGFDLDWYVASMIAFRSHELKQFPATTQTFFKPDGSPWKPALGTEAAERFRQPDLARTLRLLAELGAAAYYEGEIAERIAGDMADHGGLITLRDLASYRPLLLEPGLESEFHGLHLVGPRLAGTPTLFEALNILEHLDLEGAGFGTATFYHLVAEACRRAFLDRFTYLADPSFVPVPWDGLLSKEYARSLASTIDPAKATPDVEPADPWAFQSGERPSRYNKRSLAGQESTTHMTAIDRDRNMVTLTSTLLSDFGSKVVVPGTCILLNNGMAWFNPEPGFANSIAPGKRCLWAVTPTLAFKDGRPFLALGSAGGRRLITSVLQTLVGITHFGLGIQDAVSYPRVHCESRSTLADTRIGRAELENLRKMGHILELREEGYAASSFGRPNGILVDHASGLLRGGVNQYKPAWASGL